PFCFVFSSRRRHTRFSRDWSSDVCSSDLGSPPDSHWARADQLSESASALASGAGEPESEEESSSSFSSGSGCFSSGLVVPEAEAERKSVVQGKIEVVGRLFVTGDEYEVDA